MLRFAGAGASHPGLVRPSNQDSGYTSPALLLVADGVGGGAAGDVASATTAYAVAATVAATVAAHVAAVGELGATAIPGDPDAPVEVLRSGVLRAQQQVALGVRQAPERAGMATTLTAVLALQGRFAMAHLGDSRCYLWRGRTLTRLSRDHTWVAEQLQAGTMTPAEAGAHPWRNVVMRSICGRPEDQADLVPLQLVAGDRVLVASDGLSDLVDESWMAELLVRYPVDEEAAQALVDAALACGGRDNVTVALGTVVDGEPMVARDAEGQAYGVLADSLDHVVPAAAPSVSAPA